MVIQKLKDKPCCVDPAEGKAAEILSYITSPDFTVRYKPKSKVCGETPFLNMIDVNKRIEVGPLTWGRSCCAGGESGLNGLASTILHEAIHGLYNTTRHADETE